jgi:hypothetical protein
VAHEVFFFGCNILVINGVISGLISLHGYCLYILPDAAETISIPLFCYPFI